MTHLSRKNPCVSGEMPAEKCYICEGCNRGFTRADNLKRHAENCSGPRPTVEQLQRQVDDLQRQLVNQQQQITGELHAAAGPSVINNIDNSTNNIDNSVTVNIQMNSFGRETQDFLESMTYADLKKALKLTPDHETLLRMICLIHANNKFPENRNICMDSKESTSVNVFRRGKWKQEATDATIHDLIVKNCMRFIDVQPALEEGMPKKKFEALSEYLAMAEDMSNSCDATLHDEYSFQDLMSLIKAKLEKPALGQQA